MARRPSRPRGLNTGPKTLLEQILWMMGVCLIYSNASVSQTLQHLKHTAFKNAGGLDAERRVRSVLGTTARVEGIVDQSARNRCTTETPGAPLLPRDRVDEIAVAFSL